MKYILKNNQEIESIPIGKSSVKIGEKSPNNQFEVVDRVPNLKGKGAYVICKCNCGNYFVTSLAVMRNNQVKSCGCLNEEIFKEKGKILGKLPKKTKDYSTTENPYYEFIEKINKKNKNGFYWKVKCKKCGNLYEEIPSQLVSQSRPNGNNPCNCWKKESKGVSLIKILLEKNNIVYETEKTFSDCFSPLGNLMKFDFFIDNKYLLEFDGEQHFLPEKFNNSINGEDKLKKQKEYDKIKNDWCKNKNIVLIRIPYTHLKELKLEDLLENSKFKI